MSYQQRAISSNMFLETQSQFDHNLDPADQVHMLVTRSRNYLMSDSVTLMLCVTQPNFENFIVVVGTYGKVR